MILMVRRQLRANRTSLIIMATLMAAFTAIQVQAYRSAFPDSRTRAALLADLTRNGALRAIYGYPYDVSSATGWLAWRGMSSICVIMAVWAAFISVGALRGEEDAGRGELTLSGPQPRRRWLLAALLATTIETLVIGAVTAIGLIAVGVSQSLMTVAGCLAIALQLILPGLLFAAVGAVTSQLLGNSRGARIAAVAVVAAAFLDRTVADADSGITWLRWTGPLGWFEELHPPAAPAPGALVAIAATFVVLVLVALRLLGMRDIGLGLVPHHDHRKPRLWLLGAAWQAALRDEVPQLTVWLVGTLSYVLLLGGLTKTILNFYQKNSTLSGLLGTHFELTAYLAAAFSMVQLVVALLTVTLIVGARSEEASGRLELLLTGPLSRTRWLLSRTVPATGIALVVALLSAVALWAGAALGGQNVGLGPIIAAALNCLPLIVLCVGGTATVLALAPRAVVFMYAPVAVAYLWEAIGSALQAPPWALNLSPFHVVAAIPREDFALLPAATLTMIGLAFMVVAITAFGRRDLAVV